MKVAVIRFPGSNCDQDALHALRDQIGLGADYVWHADTSLAGFDAVFIPGGFSYGDYLRCGAVASRAPIMGAVQEFATAGKPVIGVCNGFQVLTEAGLLPGALLLNEKERFVCKDVSLRPESRNSLWLSGVDKVLRIPIAHGEGRYTCDPETLKILNEEGRIAFRYCSPSGELGSAWNPNGSLDHIAGILNEKGNVLGMMPHPERACNASFGNADGALILKALTLVNSRA